MNKEEHIENLKIIASDMPSNECADWIDSIIYAIEAIESQRYQPIILQDGAVSRGLRAILDTETDDIYLPRLTKQGANLLGITIKKEVEK